MTKGQKCLLREHHLRHPHLSQQDLALWCAHEFRLHKPPCRMTLYRILVDTATTTGKPNSKTDRAVTSAALEERLIEWVQRCEEHRLPVVTGATVRAKAAKIRDELVAVAADREDAVDRLRAFVFSPGWLVNFQRRHGLTSKRAHGEASSTSSAAVGQGRARLQQLTVGYELEDVFNMDETAFFFCAAPTRSISKMRMAGRKNQKKRLTVAVCCNATGSVKLPLLFIGAVHQPRCFEKKSAEELGVNYECTKRGWMTTVVFQRWLEDFNKQMRSQERHVLLLVDNVSSHRLDTPLSNVNVQALPPNTTAMLQPLDAGIIASFKAHIARAQHRAVVDKFDDLFEQMEEVAAGDRERAIDKLFTVDVLVAMRWAQEAWSQVTSATVSSCWRHTQVLDEDVYELIESVRKLRVQPPSMRALSC